METRVFGTQTNFNDIIVDGPWISYRAYDDINAAATAAAGKTLLIDSQVDITANTTIAATVNVVVLNGGSFNISGGVTLTILGSFDAGMYQVFSGTGSVSFWNNTFLDVVYPEWWGAVADNSTAGQGALINKAIASSTNTSEPLPENMYTQISVKLAPGTYIVGDETITLYNHTNLFADGFAMTKLKMAANSDKVCIATNDFVSLTGQNKWKRSEGVIDGFVLKGILIDGNKANQASGNGVSIYGKRYFIEDLVITDAKDVGFYSEAGTSLTGGDLHWQGMPEAIIKSIYIDDSGSHNFHYRGPHDGTVGKLFSKDAGADGVRIESGGAYKGTIDISFIHSYGCVGNGIYSNAWAKGDYWIGEANWGNGMIFETNWINVAVLEAYGNDRSGTSTYFDILVSANEAMFGQVQVNTQYAAAGGLKLAGSFAQIGEVHILATGTGITSKGVIIDSSGNTISGGYIKSYSGAGGIGLQTNPVTNGNYNDINLHISNCATLWNNAKQGQRNRWKIRLNAAAGQTAFSGFGPQADNSEHWEVTGYNTDTTSTVRSQNKGTATVPNGSTTVNVTHGLLSTPALEDVKITPTNNLGTATKFWVSAVAATTFTITVDADPGATTATFAWQAHL